MAKEKFNWKGLFIAEDENSPKIEQKKEEEPVRSSSSITTFPKSTNTATTFPVQSSGSKPVSNDILSNVIDMYESGFESLNKPGYDFYEFFKAIKAVGSNDPSVYKMAITMAQSVDSKVTKNTLLSEADFYVKEIEKVHQHYSTQGNSKKSQLLESQKKNKDGLNTEISALERQLLEIQNQISDKKNKLQSLDIELMSDVSEIDQKVLANDAARSKILETITVVIDGLKNNL